MIFCKNNSGPKVEISKEAPNVGTPYAVDDKKNSGKNFYENNPIMNQIVGGYHKGPDNSYAKDLVKKYPLRNE